MLIAEYDYRTDIEVQREEAWEEGREEGRSEGIRAIIRTCRKHNVSREETLAELIQEFALQRETAEQYLKDYWNESQQ